MAEVDPVLEVYRLGLDNCAMSPLVKPQPPYLPYHYIICIVVVSFIGRHLAVTAFIRTFGATAYFQHSICIILHCSHLYIGCWILSEERNGRGRNLPLFGCIFEHLELESRGISLFGCAACQNGRHICLFIIGVYLSRNFLLFNGIFVVLSRVPCNSA